MVSCPLCRKDVVGTIKIKFCGWWPRQKTLRWMTSEEEVEIVNGKHEKSWPIRKEVTEAMANKNGW